MKAENKNGTFLRENKQKQQEEEGAIAQQILPFISPGATAINHLISVVSENDSWTYYHGGLPIYTHPANDQRMFRFITSQLVSTECCRQVDIIKTFEVSKKSVLRSVKKLRNEGADAFFKPRKRRHGGTKLTPDVLKQAQILLNQGMTRTETAQEIGVKTDTLRKAIGDGRLHEPALPQSVSQEHASSKSERDLADGEAADILGTACTRVAERALAAFGQSDGAKAHFEPCLDVPKGGVLCSLPALLANGIMEGSEVMLGQVKGYYTMFHILLLLAYMALCRIKTVEQIRGHAPGELGKLMGLDRVPEVRCLRQKMDALSQGQAAEGWAAHLSKYWMERDIDTVGTLYIDGHVRVYHGGLTKPPRRYVSRERLCLRGTSDYWVNDATGRPFFMVEKAIDPGLIKTLENDIVPRLLKDIPNQPTPEELSNNPFLCRFILVFDREGYSPAFFHRMWVNHRIGCMTYHKHPDIDWPETSFTEQTVTMPGGEVVQMLLAERGSLVGSGKQCYWMREVRKLTKTGHQTSIISTAYDLSHTIIAASMFSRWCQENFFRYMMQHFAIDLLQEYGTEEFSGTEEVVNPEWRELDRQRNSLNNKLRYRRAKFGQLTHHAEPEQNEKSYNRWLKKKSELLEEIESLEHQLGEIKAKIKQTQKHILWSELADEDKFYRLVPSRKRLTDTVRMIAYRAETAMAGLLVGDTINMPAARTLLQDLYKIEADILPELENGRLRIRVHGASRPAANKALKKLFEKLNESETKYPGTDLCLFYELGVG